MASMVDTLAGIQMENFKITVAPQTVFYIPNFITQAQEQSLINSVNSSPKPRWTQLTNRRLQNWGGVPHPNGMIAEEIPNWLKIYTSKLANLKLFEGKVPNHVLVNEYLPGQGIMPHQDGPLFYPTIATINLGSHTILNFYHPHLTNAIHQDNEGSCLRNSSNVDDSVVFSIFLEPRSLLILKDKAYDYFLHGIDELKEDHLINNENIINFPECSGLTQNQTLSRTTRISLTIRYVPKTTHKPVIKLSR